MRDSEELMAVIEDKIISRRGWPGFAITRVLI
jgi:hypothetical protein